MRMPIIKGHREVLIIRGADPTLLKHIRILKDCQSMPDDNKHCLIVHGIRFEGSFEKVEKSVYKIEFVGDSITSGEGITGAHKEQDWIPMNFCASMAYERIASDILNAEFRVFSQSGWGVVSGWDNNPKAVISENYTKVCGSLKGELNKSLGAQEDYDFGSWKADAVVINLGTNDKGAFDSPEFTDPLTGEKFKERRDENGARNPDDLERFTKKSEEFLSLVRKKNSTAKIVWAYGMLGHEMNEQLKTAVENRKKAGDADVYFFSFPDTSKELLGSRDHPGPAANKNCGKLLAEFLKTLL
jgi:lysophospholipase L1-like esterase